MFAVVALIVAVAVAAFIVAVAVAVSVVVVVVIVVRSVIIVFQCCCSCHCLPPIDNYFLRGLPITDSTRQCHNKETPNQGCSFQQCCWF